MQMVQMGGQQCRSKTVYRDTTFKTQHTSAKEFPFSDASTVNSALRREQLVAMKESLLKEIPSTWCILWKLKPSARHDITRKHFLGSQRRQRHGMCSKGRCQQRRNS